MGRGRLAAPMYDVGCRMYDLDHSAPRARELRGFSEGAGIEVFGNSERFTGWVTRHRLTKKICNPRRSFFVFLRRV